MHQEHNTAEITGNVEKTLFKSTETGFGVFVLAVNGRERVTITGHLPDLQNGEQVVVRGVWSFHAKFGRQLQVTTCAKRLPSDILGIKKYLGSGLVKGIGPKFAERLVDHFGAATLHIIDTNPDRLHEVAGVGPRRVDALIKAWKDQREISTIMVFLQGKGISTGFASKIYKAYGANSIAKITENPYRLAEDLWGVGFKTADDLALKIGLEPTSLYRVKAGVVYVITEAINNGHLYIKLEDVKEKVPEVLGIVPTEIAALLRSALQELYRDKKIILLPYQDQHFLSLPQYYWSEKGIAQRIQDLQRYPGIDRININAVYDLLRQDDGSGITLNEDQQRGIMAALQTKITIITGGPGTGKTTLVKKLLEILASYRVRCRLAAPTGRAAKRLFEGTKANTETIHRLLEFSPHAMGFARNEQNAIEAEFIIIDEASMIDVFLMHALLKAIPAHAHLVLLGDVDQLPSVGAGNVLQDLIHSHTVAVIKLLHIFRQAQDSMIIVNAHRINHGDFPVRAYEESKKDFIYMRLEEPEEIFPLLRDLYQRRLVRHGVAIDDAVVLTPMNRGIAGTQRINQELQMIINPADPHRHEISRFGTIFRVGDRVMQVRNNYDKFVFNGDMGKIATIDRETQQLLVQFGERELAYDLDELDELMLAYAVSIHKSQGSEFGAAIVPIFMQHFVLLQRNLLYTAVTRAKRLCILIGQPKAIGMAIKNNKEIKRQTFLEQFLTSDLAAR